MDGRADEAGIEQHEEDFQKKQRTQMREGHARAVTATVAERQR